MLDDVERRTLLVQPAGKHTLPAFIVVTLRGSADEQLHERAG
jgi:hypothetical protein